MTKRFTFNELWNRLPSDVRNACANCEQDPIYHPEGNVDVHIRLVFEHAVNHFDSDVDLLVAAIFHDLGKPETKKVFTKNDGTVKISNIGHENKCISFIDKYFHLFLDVTINKEKVTEICLNHMRAHIYKNKQMSKPAKRKAFENLKYFEDIMKFSECDEMGKIIKLFLDDIRFPIDVFKYTDNIIYKNNSDWIIVRSYNDFINYIEINKLPTILSLDHDLGDYLDGCEKTGYDCAKWLCDYCQEHNVKFPEYYIHSMNPVGALNIKYYIENYKKHVEGI